MKVVNGNIFNGVDEEFERDVEVVETIKNKGINWNNFEANDVVINCKEDCREVSIKLNGGKIDGSLTINGLDQKLNNIKIIGVEVEKIAVYNLEAKRIEITGNVGDIEIINSNADDYHICGEVEKSIILFRSGSKKSSFELNGYAKNVRLKNVIADDFRIESFKFKKLTGLDIKIKDLHLPTDWKCKLKFADVKKLHLFKSGEATGVIHNLSSATLKF